ncbi:MAG: ferredoxin--NADP reductase [Planctomycetota bacterium]
MSDDLWDKLNATVTERTDVAPGLAVIRVVADGDLFPFVAGQYCVLGLPPDAGRVPDSEEEEPRDEKKRKKMIRRAYSIASSSKENEYLDFYVALVNSGEFTPRLFALDPGDRIWLGPKATGLFTLEQVPSDADLYLIATGTGLAPYISMLRGDLLADGTRRIVVAHGARFSWDLGYRKELEGMAHGSDRLTYIPSITRGGKDESFRGETGYLQEQLASGRMEELSGVPLDPATTHVFLCGNPAMIEAAVEDLRSRGFSEWTRKTPEGQIHLEKYW